MPSRFPSCVSKFSLKQSVLEKIITFLQGLNKKMHKFVCGLLESFAITPSYFEILGTHCNLSAKSKLNCK